MSYYDKLRIFFTNNFNQNIEFIQNSSYFIFAIIYALVVNLATPFLLIAIAVVEFNRVNYGLSVSNNSVFSALMAITLVVSVVVIEMLITYLQYKHGVTQYKLNRKLIWKNLTSFVSSEITEQNENETSIKRFKQVRFFVIVGVILSSTAGVLNEDEILRQVLWYEAPTHILKNSNLVDFIKYLDIFFLTVVFVFLAQRFSEHVSKQYFEAIDLFAGFKTELELEGRLTVAQFLAKMPSVEIDKIGFLNKETDLVDVEKGQIYDSERDIWSKQYKSRQTIVNNLYRLNEQRRKTKKIGEA
jgi:hypothetical protein